MIPSNLPQPVLFKICSSLISQKKEEEEEEEPGRGEGGGGEEVERGREGCCSMKDESIPFLFSLCINDESLFYVCLISCFPIQLAHTPSFLVFSHIFPSDESQVSCLSKSSLKIEIVILPRESNNPEVLKIRYREVQYTKQSNKFPTQDNQSDFSNSFPLRLSFKSQNSNLILKRTQQNLSP